MHTHRYVRNRLVEDNKRDRYDLNVRRFGCGNCYYPRSNINSNSNNAHKITEYWTNGRTTLLHIPNPVSGASNQPSNSCTHNNHTCYSQAVDRTIMTMVDTLPEPPSSPRLPTDAKKAASTTFSKDSSKTSNNIIRNSLIAGSAAGMASTIACHPFDVLRVKMQGSAPLATATTAATAAPSSNASTIGLIGTIRSTLQFGGVRALYTGLTLPLAAQALYKGTVFTVNNLTESTIREWKTQENYKLGKFEKYQLTLLDRFVSGFMGGAFNAALFCTPVEYVRNQQIAQLGSNDKRPINGKAGVSGPISVIRRTIQSNGVAGLWRGMTSTILRDSVGCGLFFVAMAYAQEQSVVSTPQFDRGIDHESQQQQLSTSTIILSGALAGVAYWLWALPVDTIKTWIQSGTASSLTHAFQMSHRHGFLQTIPSLFRGWQVAYTRGAPSAAITVATYTAVFRHLQQPELEHA